MDQRAHHAAINKLDMELDEYMAFDAWTDQTQQVPGSQVHPCAGERIEDKPTPHATAAHLISSRIRPRVCMYVYIYTCVCVCILSDSFLSDSCPYLPEVDPTPPPRPRQSIRNQARPDDLCSAFTCISTNFIFSILHVGAWLERFLTYLFSGFPYLNVIHEIVFAFVQLLLCVVMKVVSQCLLYRHILGRDVVVACLRRMMRPV